MPTGLKPGWKSQILSMLRLLDGMYRVYRFCSQSPIQNDFLKPEDHTRIVALLCGERVSASNLFPESSFFAAFCTERKALSWVSVIWNFQWCRPQPEVFFRNPRKAKVRLWCFDGLYFRMRMTWCLAMNFGLQNTFCRIISRSKSISCVSQIFLKRMFCQIFQTRNGLYHKPIGMRPIKSINNPHRRNC